MACNAEKEQKERAGERRAATIEAEGQVALRRVRYSSWTGQRQSAVLGGNVACERLHLIRRRMATPSPQGEGFRGATFFARKEFSQHTGTH